MTLSAGTRLGPYEIVAAIGAGGMGEVYRARDTRLGREVAVKVLPQQLAEDASRLRRFEKEARAASALNHPNIVTVYEVGSADSVSYMAMELVNGRTFRELLADGVLPIRKLLQLAPQIADGLARAHKAGIVHRDLKPENLMVTTDGFVKILDFGLAKLAHPELEDGGSVGPTVTKGTEPGTVMGTVGYMSPEQASAKAVDYRSDQFSLGSILYEMATGRRAFQRDTAVQTLAAIVQEESEAIGTINPRVPAPFAWIVERCLAKDPDERFASTQDLARDLASVRDHVSEASSGAKGVETGRRRWRSRLAPAAVAAAAVAAIGVAFLAGRGLRPAASEPSFQRLTFRRGTVSGARFAPDGQTIVYSAAWDGSPAELFTTRLGASESRPLGFGNAGLMAMSSQGEMAFSLKSVTTGDSPRGTLARAPLAGGAPREILEDVQGADWSPDGKQLVVVRVVGGRRRLEYPPGKVLYEVPASEKLASPRFSPRGDGIAFIEGPSWGYLDGSVALIDLSGKKRALTSHFATLSAFAWTGGGDELWFAAPRPGGDGNGLYAVTLSGRQRLLHASSSGLRVEDVSRDGRLLVVSIQARFGVVALAPGDRSERELSWLDWSRVEDLSADGRMLLLNEEGAGGGPNGSVYIRKADGSPAVRLGEGWGTAFSSDGKWVVTIPPGESHLVLLPIGAGETKTIRYPGIQAIRRARCFPDDRHLLLVATEPKRGERLYVGDWEGGSLHPISPEGIRNVGFCLSPDGEIAAAVGPEGVVRLYPASGGAPRAVPGIERGEVPLRFSADGRALFIARLSESSAVIDRIELASGRREIWKELKGHDPAGLSPSIAIQITPDGRSYAYTYRRVLTDLFLVEGLR